MPNPLHKNRVISLIKSFPHDTRSVLIQNNTPLANVPGQPDKPTTSILPGCTVGLAGENGNPKDFNNLVAMWLKGGAVRANLNPLAIMRLWAACYRTYYDWITQVQRRYFNPNSVQLVTSSTFINPNTYKVEFIAPIGSGTIKGQELTGNVTLSSNYEFSTGIGYKEFLSNIIADVDLNTPGGVNSFAFNSYIYESYPDIWLKTRSVSGNSYKYLQAPFGAYVLMNGGPVTMKITFDEPSDITKIKMPSPFGDHSGGTYTASNGTTANQPNWLNYDNPNNSLRPFNWFFPTDFKIRTSADGVVYNNSLQFGTQLTSLAATKYYAAGVANDPANLQFQRLNPKHITSVNLDKYSTFQATLSLGGIRFASHNINYTGITPFDAKITSVTTNNSSYNTTSLPGVGQTFSANRSYTMDVPLANGTLKTCTVASNIDVSKGKILVNNNGSQSAIGFPVVYANEYADDILFQIKTQGILLVKDGNTVVYQANFLPTIVPLTNIKVLELTSGIQESGVFRPYLGSFPYIEGTTKISTTIINDAFVEGYQPDFTDSYWSNNNPSSYSLNGATYSDSVASQAFEINGMSGSGYTNVDRWKLLPYTLPRSGYGLQMRIEDSAITIRNLPSDFNYTEDYISNDLIPVPQPSSLSSIEQEAAIKNLPPYVYYLTKQMNLLLTEIVDYAQSTCLRVFSYTKPGFQVSNYKEYTKLVLSKNNALDTVPLDVLGGTNNISVIDIPTPVDIETSLQAGKMWFLSGGGASRVDVDIAVLQKLLEVSGIMQ